MDKCQEENFYQISPISVYLLGRGTNYHSSHTSICPYNKYPCNTETVAPCRDMEGMFAAANWNGLEWVNLTPMSIIPTTAGRNPLEEME